MEKQDTNKNPKPTNNSQEDNKEGYNNNNCIITSTIYFVLFFIFIIIATDLKHISIVLVSSFLGFLAIMVYYFFMNNTKKVYLVEFACCKPHPSCRTTKATCMDRIALQEASNKENIEFQRRLFERSGLGDETYLPDAVIRVPPEPTLVEARKEAETVMFGAIDQLLENTQVLGKEIGILVVNCSVFNPMPSLCAAVINRYKLKEDVLTYNLGGMGCSAGLISIDLAKNLLQVHPNSYALIVSLESLTQNWYSGNNRSMLISNCLFRMGGAAILLSNKPSDRDRSKYQLVHLVRTHIGANDMSYKCAYQQEDDACRRGLSLSKDLMAVAGKALKANITTLGPLVLPISEQLIFLIALVRTKIFRIHMIKQHVPNFKLAFEHFCIHAGGRAVLDELEKSFKLSNWHMEPSRMTLYRYGNTSSSSLWYELAYLEAKQRVKKGDKTWQIGFGSGFKCNSSVWCALCDIYPNAKINPWMEEIDKFPVDVPQVSTIILPSLR